ncbi:AraC family transcriptional regulator [Gloeocapsopsis sp. IPPAS B-1203]|uniref:helix-turn-helix transcriptional regulator n=1 Tax=Gloeocapsopsis sp. IPPAS B-1203 TaxID=2049454 RepID=UPI000C1742D4|nr:AraC family transcriptional regulator [Gloeocapsopsis sp. IPPAS B-1203]PIG94712.1 AraC family transcriptional regulator [Gloeocapsopsis sp. IPPAS B-1203]
MAIALSYADYCALLQENADSKIASHQTDITLKYPSQLGHGFMREVRLREGLALAIADYQYHDDIIIYTPDREHLLEYTFNIPDDYSSLADAIPYHLFGSGIALRESCQEYANQRIIWVSVHINPDVFRAFAGTPDGEVPNALQHLIGDPNQEYYVRPGQATPAMHIALRQILHCPYQGFTQRMFLEGKVLELMSLLLEQEAEIHLGKQAFAALKPDDVDRVYYAKDILLQQLNNPPSLTQLARQVGLNECTLKRGFRQVFGTTAFSYLYEYRLEQARQLLQERRLNVSEVAHSVGFGSCSHLSKAFRHKYGISPKQYQTQYHTSDF